MPISTARSTRASLAAASIALIIPAGTPALAQQGQQQVGQLQISQFQPQTEDEPSVPEQLAQQQVAQQQLAQQQQAQYYASSLDEILVTAQKTETNLQQTPIAISVLGGDDLRNRGVQSLGDLMTGGVPSLRIVPFFSRSSALTVGIRGIVPFDANQPSRDAGVGVYIDGVYLGRSQGLGAALFDVERIEVLKGPQGTLFGRNSTGGAVSIVTREPSGEFQLRQTVGISNFDGHKSETHLDLPQWGTVSFKIDGIVSKRDGTVSNPMQGEENFNKYDRRGIRVAAKVEPSDDFKAVYSYDNSYDATTPYYVQLLEKNPASAALAPLVKVQAERTKVADIGLPQEDNVGLTWGHSLHMNLNVSDDFEIRSISSYRRVKQDQLDNSIGAHSGPFTPNATFARYSLASLRQEQYSQEFQFVGGFDEFDYVAGAYYYHEKGDDDAWTPNTMRWDALGLAPVRLPSLEAGAQVPFPDRASTALAKSSALFGQGTWSPAAIEGLHVTGGARYTHDKKKGTLTKVNGANTAFTFDTSSNRLDPAVIVAYDATSDLHVYGKWGTAYRAGGANSRSVNYRSFDPEKVSTFEAGLKSDFWDGRARLNLAAYTSRYKDIQIDFSATNLLQSNRGTLETVNAPGHGTIKGFEADAVFGIADSLTFSTAYAYTESKLPQAANPFRNNVIQNVYIVYTPKHAVSGAFDYEVPVDGMTVRAHLDANIANGYRSSSSEAGLTDKSFVVNGRIALTDIELADQAVFELAVWSRNLFNEDHTFYESRGSFAAIGSFGMFNEPRTFGIDATVKF